MLEEIKKFSQEADSDEFWPSDVKGLLLLGGKAIAYIRALIDMVEQRDKEIEQVIDTLGITKPNPTIEEIVLVIGCIKVNEKELQDRLDGWEMSYADFVRDYFESYPDEEEQT